MTKVIKGNPGYLDYKKKIEIIKTIIYFGIVAAIFFLGYSQTHSRLNMLTVVAILGCLPASKSLVGVITRFPYSSIDKERVKEIEAVTRHLTVSYDMVITSRDKIMPVDCIVISGNKVFGYTHSEKVDLPYTQSHIKTILSQNQLDGVSVKLFDSFKAFLARAEGLESIQKIEKNETQEREETIKHVILNISM